LELLGLYILKAIGKYSDNNNTETDKIEFLMWDIIIPSTYVEMYHSDYSIDNNLPLIKHRLTNSLEKLDQLISNGVEYPCSYLLMYRSLLLDKNQQQYFGVRAIFLFPLRLSYYQTHFIHINRENCGRNWLH